MKESGSDFEERVYNILANAWKRMEDAHNNGERASIDQANQKALEAFEARPITDTSEWYKTQYAKAGLVLPEMQADKREVSPKDRVGIGKEIMAFADRMIKISKTRQASMESRTQRCARDDSMAR
jgi:hypothetical protein